jgi:hypothetical protein
MNIPLSWDLFVLVFFVIIVAYSFIIGRDNTLKVILGTYVAALASDAAGNLFSMSFGESALFIKLLNLAGVETGTEAVVFVKVLIFVTLVILFAVRGAYEVNTTEDRSAGVRMIISFVYAILSAGLIISIVLVFMSGISFVGGGANTTTTSALADLSNQSRMIKSMLNYTYLWFTLPALAFLVHSLYSTRSDD